MRRERDGQREREVRKHRQDTQVDGRTAGRDGQTDVSGHPGTEKQTGRGEGNAETEEEGGDVGLLRHQPGRWSVRKRDREKSVCSFQHPPTSP